jgi:hypothetical protein
MGYIARYVACIMGLIGSSLSGCAASSQPLSGSLQLEEHQLLGAPDSESFSFQPVQGDQEQILANHADQRSMTYPKEVRTIEGNPVISSLGDTEDLLAVLVTPVQGQPEMVVRVIDGGEVIFENYAGLPSPEHPLHGLWTYDGHWALEILLADQSTWAGQVFIDGEWVNEINGYDEAFGLQLLGGKPFYFFLRDGRVGYSYSGQEFDLEYDEIPHYRCCSESSLNPVQAEDMVAFFAQRGETWFYVELGHFDE